MAGKSNVRKSRSWSPGLGFARGASRAEMFRNTWCYNGFERIRPRYNVRFPRRDLFQASRPAVRKLEVTCNENKWRGEKWRGSNVREFGFQKNGRPAFRTPPPRTSFLRAVCTPVGIQETRLIPEVDLQTPDFIVL